MADKIDSNVTGAFYAEETSPKVVANDAPWYEMEPNTFSDFGGQLAYTRRNPIKMNRQQSKGSPTDIDVSAGMQQDFTLSNHLRILRGFFFADYATKFGTAEVGTAPVPIASIDAGANSFDLTGSPAFAAGALLYAQGFTKSANNGLHVVSAAVAADAPVTVTSDLTAEVVPAAARIVQVGFQFAAGDVAIDAYPGGFTLTSTAIADMAALTGLRIGAYVFVGGDANGNAFAQRGYARVADISGATITFDKATTNFADSAGAGVALRLFWGRYIRNEDDPTLIKAFSYQFGRTLGRDADGVQSQYIEGAFANTLQINIPTPGADAKLTADLTFVALDDKPRTGAVGVKPGPRVKSPNEDAINTSSDVYRLRLHVVDDTTVNATPLFGYVTEGNITINNNLSVGKAVGVFGGFAVNVGDFIAGGQLTGYFSTVEAISAIRYGADLSFDLIVAKHNAGFIFDMPLLGVGGGRLNIAKDQPITIPVDMNGAENPQGYTASMTFFPYLPDAAMPAR